MGLDFYEDEGEDLVLLSNFYKQCNYFANLFKIPWAVNSYKEIVSNGKKKYGDYYDFYEGEIAIVIQQGIPILLRIIDEIKKLIQVEESFWEIKNPLLLKYIENILDENINSINNCIYWYFFSFMDNINKQNYFYSYKTTGVQFESDFIRLNAQYFGQI